MRALIALFAFLLVCTPVFSDDSSVPLVIHYGGALPEGAAAPGATVELTFALYGQQSGGAVLWTETHEVKVSADRRYAVLLGAKSDQGLPVELFSNNEARWLGVTLAGGEEAARILLVSVPYALKAGEADRLAGRAASDYMLADEWRDQIRAQVDMLAQERMASAVVPEITPDAIVVSGTVGKLAKFTAPDGVGDSVVTEDTGRIGINTTPTATLHVQGPPSSQLLLLQASAAGNSGLTLRNPTQTWSAAVRGDQANRLVFRNTTGAADVMTLGTNNNVGIGTSNPTRRLHVVGFSDLQVATFESAISGNIGFGFLTPDQNWGLGNRFDLGNSFAIRNITAAMDALVVRTSGNVGIGVGNPAHRLHVGGTVQATSFIGDGSLLTNVPAGGLAGGTYTNSYVFSNTANNFTGSSFVGGSGQFWVTSTDPAVFGFQYGTGYAGYFGSANPGGVTLQVDANASSGMTQGIRVYATNSPDGRGLYSEATAYGVYSQSSGTAYFGMGGNRGLEVIATNTDSIGADVYANAAGNAIGVRGTATNSSDGTGVRGDGGHTGVYGQGQTRGAYFKGTGTGAVGVVAQSTTNMGTSIGLHAIVQSQTGTAGRFEALGFGGTILKGIDSNAAEVFTVAHDGTVTATKFVGDGSMLTNLPVSSGDITAVNAGTGLSGGGTSGDVTLNADTAVIQARVSGTCSSGQSIRAIDIMGNVTCEVDDNSGGDITAVTAGTGLTGGGTTGAVSLNADLAVVQARLSSSCPEGQSIRAVDGMGNVTCEADDNTIYAAGTGLSLGGNTFSADLSAVQARLTGSCPNGESIRAVDAMGNVSCEVDDNTTYTAGTGLSLIGNAFSLNFDPATQAELDAHKSSSDHDTRYLQLSGGTLTGGLTATTGEFNGVVRALAGMRVPELAQATPGGGFNSSVLDLAASVYDSGAGAVERHVFRWEAEPVNNNTASGSARLVFRWLQQDPITDSYTSSISGLSINPDGTINFAPGQAFPGSGVGDITAVNAGSGLTGGGTAGDVTLNADTTVLQSRVTGTCSAGSSIRVIAADGSVTCEADDNSGGDITSVNAGSGLTGGSTSGDATLSVAAGGITSSHIADGSVSSTDITNGTILFADMNQNGCGTTQIMKWSGSAWACANDNNSGGDATLAGNNTFTGQNTFSNPATFSYTPYANDVSSGPVFINPPSVSYGANTLFGAALNGAQKFRLDADGNVTAAGTGSFSGGNVALTGTTTGSDTIGVKGESSATGVEGRSTGNGVGVSGIVLGSTGGFAVSGVIGSTGGTAISGDSMGASGIGVDASANSTSGTPVAVRGFVQRSNGIAGWFQNGEGGMLIVGYTSYPAGAGTQVFGLDGSGNINTAGNVTATGFIGDGSGLTGLGASSDLNCAGCVSSDEVSFNYAGSSTKGGTANDSEMLDGLDSAAFARLATANSFSEQNTFTSTPLGAAVGQGPLLVNPGSAAADSTLFGAAVGGTQKFRIDAEGDVTARAGFFGGLVSVALEGQGSSSGLTFGVKGNTSSTAGAGMRADATAATGQTFGVHAVNSSDDGIALFGVNNSTAGSVGGFGIGPIGVKGTSASTAGIAGLFDNFAGGIILRGSANNVEKFRVDGSGNVRANSYLDLAGNHAGDTRYAQLVATNNFTGDQNITGNISLTGSINGGLRIETGLYSPNIIEGSGGNYATSGTYGVTISGGGGGSQNNRVTDYFGTIGGGYNNQAGDDAGVISDAGLATVSGGIGNIASAAYATVGGGQSNTASGVEATVAGGRANSAAVQDGFIGGGTENSISGGQAGAIAGGEENVVSGSWAFVGGGVSNEATNQYAAVAGGNNGLASGAAAFVGAGEGNTASGNGAMVVGGYSNLASGEASFASGRQAKAMHSGSFVWGDYWAFDIASTASNQFLARSTGGVIFVSGIDGSGVATAGVKLAAGGSTWTDLAGNPLGGTATDVNCGGACVSSAEVDFNYAGSSSKGGAAANADLLDSLDSTAFVQLAGTNSFSGMNTFALTPTGAAANQGPLYVNPASASSNYTLLGVAVGGTEKLRIDAEGDLAGRSASFSGSVAYAVDATASSSGVATGVRGASASTSGTGVRGDASASTGQTFAVHGVNASEQGIGVLGVNNHAGNASAYAVKGGLLGTAGTAVYAQSSNPSGTSIALHGEVVSSSATPLLLDLKAGSGNLLVARSGSPSLTNKFRVDSTGQVYAAGYTTGGADFAESFDVVGEKEHYEPGDVMAIDADGDRRLTLVAEPYSTRVAGIYSTKPGVLASPHPVDSPELAAEVPLAVVGIVPCKVTAENGPIRRGDLLVSSSKAGYAMKGTDRTRIVGAIVGKALQTIEHGEGVIEVLVTLQ